MSKEIAIKPICGTMTYASFGCFITRHTYYKCGACGAALNAGPNYQPNYCDRCGQRADFSTAEWTADEEAGWLPPDKRLRGGETVR